MSIKQNLDKWIAELESDGMCDISDNQVIALIRGYSAIEAKCEALRVQLELSVAAERAWERTMMYACGEDGPKSVADKFSELQAKCAALAAELKQSQIDAGCYKHGMESSNARLAQLAAEPAGLKSAIDTTIGWQQSTDPENVESVRMLLDIKIPATDAFLAEVRAAAVDEVCLKISNAIVNCYQDEMVGLDEAATICGDFAAQLRKGVQA